jgi:adenylyl cyclase-associated protein
LGEIGVYVKKYHTTGLAWNPRGPGATSLPPPNATSSIVVPAAAPAAKIPTSAGLFSELDGKDALTSGLKKVDKSQMTHKNPELRATSVVPTKEPAGKTFGGTAAKIVRPPKFELEGNKWVVENQINATIEIKETELRHVVYIYNCVGSTITVANKVNALTIGKIFLI